MKICSTMKRNFKSLIKYIKVKSYFAGAGAMALKVQCPASK